MANPFLVLGGIAISVATAAFGILQVPGWVAAAQDASVINDLSNIRQAQAAAVSQSGKYATNLDALSSGFGLQLVGGGSFDTVRLQVKDGSWCATAQSESGSFHAVSERTAVNGSGPTATAAAEDAGCVPLPCEGTEWAASYFAGNGVDGPVLASQCLDDLNWTHDSSGSLVPGVPAADYSARFTTTINDGAGTYNFEAYHDDSARVFIDGNLVWSAWYGSTGYELKTFSVQLGNGPHDVVVEYYQGTKSARLVLDWTVTP